MASASDILWMSALAAIPVALGIAVLCRVCVRPATRHALWLIALVSLVLPAMGIAAGAGAWRPLEWVSSALSSSALKEPRAQARKDAAAKPLVFAPRQLVEAEPQEPVVTPPVAEPRQARDAGDAAPEAKTQPALAAPAVAALAELQRQRETLSAGPERSARAPSMWQRSAGGFATAPRSSAPAAVADRSPPSPVFDLRGAVERETGLESAGGPELALGALSGAPSAPDPELALGALSEPSAPDPELALGALSGAPSAPDSELALGALSEPSAPDPELALGARLAAPLEAPAAPSIGAVLAVEFRGYGASLAIGADRARAALSALPALPLPIWLCGSAAAIATAMVRLRVQRRRWGRASPAPAALRAQVEQVAAQLELRRAPACRITEDRISPMICCAGRPRLLLPESLWRELDAPAQRAVLLHELAHIRRRDPMWCWLQAVIGWVYWWHPVVWWVRGRIQEEADLCCDAWVVALAPGGRRVYAEALLATRSWLSAGSDRCAVGLPMATARSRRFSRRLTMVMTAPPRPRVSRAGAAIAAAVGLAGALLMPAVACPPEKEKSKARVHVTVHKAHKAEAPAEVAETAEEASTFERFMQERERDGQPEPGARGGDDEERLRRLEERLRRIEASLSELAADRERIRVRDRDRDRDRERDQERQRAPRAPESPATPGVPAAPAVPPAPPAPASHPAPPAPATAPAAAPSPHAAMSPHSSGGRLALPTPDQGEELRIRYYLPSGKLGEINDLMVRQDVPVLVSPADEYIVVIGTPDTQQRFYSFVTLIHPEGVKAVDHETGEGVTPSREHGDAGGAPHAAPATQAPDMRERVQREVRELLRQQQAELRDRLAESRARLTDLRSQARSLEAQHESAQRLSERARAEAADLKAQSHTLREKLAAAQKALSEATGSARDEAEQLVGRLETEAETFQARAMDIARRAEQAAQQSAVFADQVVNLESLARRLEEQMKAREAEVEQMIRQRLEEVEHVMRQSAEEGARRR